MAPKIVDKQSRRAEIAIAAMDLFVKKGFVSTSIREITSAAGMGKGTFYDYFENKEDILDEIARAILDRWRKMYLKDLVKTMDPLEQLRAMVSMFVSEAAEFEPLTIMYIDLLRLGVKQEEEPGFMSRFREFISDGRAAAAELIEKAKASGRVRSDVDSEAMAASLVAYIDGLAFHKMIYRDRMDLDRLWAPFFEAWLAGIE